MTKRIMVVDDTPDLLNSIAFALQMESYVVVPHTNPVEALSELEGLAPDLIITDLTMPKMDGFEFIRKVRARQHLAKIPIAIFSARPIADNYDEGMALGVSCFIGKPTSIENLITEVANIFRGQDAK